MTVTLTPENEARIPHWIDSGRYADAEALAVLDRDDESGAIAAMREVQTLAPHEGLKEFVGYLTRLAPQIPEDAAWRATGQRVGNGGAVNGRDALVKYHW